MELTEGEEPLKNEVKVPNCQISQTVLHHEVILQIVLKVENFLELECVRARLTDLKS